jgi:hypothetical protein
MYRSSPNSSCPFVETLALSAKGLCDISVELFGSNGFSVFSNRLAGGESPREFSGDSISSVMGEENGKFGTVGG